MESLILEPTEKTMKIYFDAETGFLEMEGASYSEDSRLFFQKLTRWLEQYLSEVGKPVTLSLKVQYLNSTSTKYLMDFLAILEEFYEKGGDVKVNWYYEEGDDMEEMGQEFSEELNMPFKLFVY